MLNTIGDIITEVLVRGHQNTANGYITDEMLSDWLTEKHRWAASFKKWPFTEGRVSTTYASALTTDEDGNLRGEYPEGWKPDSIRLMKIGGYEIKKMNLQAFQRFREKQPDANGQNSRVFADYGRLYYLSPNLDVSGTIAMWGQYTPANLDVTDLTATTIFSGIEEDGNEALVESILEDLYNRCQNPQEGQLHKAKAFGLLSGIWQRIVDEQFGYDNGETGMFEQINVLSGGMRDNIYRKQWY